MNINFYKSNINILEIKWIKFNFNLFVVFLMVLLFLNINERKGV